MKWLTTAEAAARLQVHPDTLRKLRTVGGGPPYIRLGPRTIRYDAAEVDAWGRQRAARSTSEELVRARAAG